MVSAYAEGVTFISLGSRACERTLGYEAIRTRCAEGVTQSLAQVDLHLVSQPKIAAPFYKTKSCAVSYMLPAYLVGTSKNQGVNSLQVGGVQDNVHLCHRLSKKLAISNLIAELKRESSRWLKPKASDLHQFYWQRGYGAFSISPSHVDGLVDYIRRQEEHHKQESFKYEFRRLCAQYDLEIDERYAWD